MSSVRTSFSFYSSPLDLLQQAIAAAERLTKRRFVLSLRRKEEETSIEIRLFNKNLFHLFGFHKIKELSPYLKGMSKRAAYAKTLQDKNLLARVAVSPCFDDIEGRLICICLFDKVLAGEKTKAFECTEQLGYLRSDIQFDYLLMATISGHRLFYFVRSVNKDKTKGVLVSLFIDDRRPYHKSLKPWEVSSIDEI